MQANPYAAPDAAGPHPDAPRQGEPQAWDVGDVYKTAWRLFGGCWAPLTGAFFVATLLGALPGQMPAVLVQAGVLEETSSGHTGAVLGFTALGFVVQWFFQAGFTRALLRVARTGQARFADVFSGGSVYLPFVAMHILLGIAVALGLLVLIVPGIILMLGTLFAGYYVVDQRMGPIEAIRASWAATEGHKSNLFVFLLASAGVGLLGALACCVGYLPAAAMSGIATAIIYLRLAGLAQGTSADLAADWKVGQGLAQPPPNAASPYGPYGPPGGAPPAAPPPAGGSPGGPWGPYGPPGG